MNHGTGSFGDVMLWGLAASVLMDVILESAQGLGFSRMSLPFLFGTFCTANRARATVYGFLLYLAGGWIFAFGYFLLFESVGLYTWWFGMAAGAVHGCFLLAAMLPLMPFVHPRMASEYHGANMPRQLEPPGYFAMNYGHATPVWTMLAQIAYGGVLGGFAQLHQAGMV